MYDIYMTFIPVIYTTFCSFIEAFEDTPFRGVLGASQTFIIGT